MLFFSCLRGGSRVGFQRRNSFRGMCPKKELASQLLPGDWKAKGKTNMETLAVHPPEINPQSSRILAFDPKRRRRTQDGEKWLDDLLLAELPVRTHGTSLLQVRRFARFATGAGLFMVERWKAGECHFTYDEIAQQIERRLEEGEMPITGRIVSRIVACLLEAGFLMRVSRDRRLCGNRPGVLMTRGCSLSISLPSKDLSHFAVGPGKDDREIGISLPTNDLSLSAVGPGKSGREELEATGTDGLASFPAVAPGSIRGSSPEICGRSPSALQEQDQEPRSRTNSQERTDEADSEGSLSIEAVFPRGIFDPIEPKAKPPRREEQENLLTVLVDLWNQAAEKLEIRGSKAPRVEKVTERLRERMRQCWKETRAEGLDPMQALSGAIDGFLLDGWGVTQGHGLAQALMPVSSSRPRTWLHFFRVATGLVKGSRQAQMGPAQRNIEKLKRWLERREEPPEITGEERRQLEAAQKEQQESSERREEERKKAVAEQEKRDEGLAALCKTQGHDGVWNRKEASDQRTCQRCGAVELRPYERKNWPSVKAKPLKLKPKPRCEHRYGPTKKNPHFQGHVRVCQDCGYESYVE